jgi:hypothetical protein
VGKRCPKCDESKSEEEFYRDKNRPDGRQVYCKMCMAVFRKGSSDKNKCGVEKIPETKRCGKCLLVKSSSEFSISRREKDGLDGRCRVCNSASTKKRRSNNVERVTVEIPRVKFCFECKKEKESRFFARNKRETSGLDNCCRECTKKWRLSFRYGVTEEWYLKKLKEQNGMCAVCGKNEADMRYKRLCVDHSHISLKVRGLLCNWCNFGIAAFYDNIQLLRNASRYISEHKGNIKDHDCRSNNFMMSKRLNSRQARWVYMNSGYACCICCCDKKLELDHCHYNGETRGVLCGLCNRGLGQFKESEVIIEKAIEYLAMYNPDVSTLGLINPPAKDEDFEKYLEDEYFLAFDLCV